MILDSIIEKKKLHLEQDVATLLPTNPGKIAQAMKKSKELYIIGELKKASPSKGIIVDDFCIQTLAQAYADAGIPALSILTEQDFFQGSLSYIKQARDIFHGPILRKDFLMDVREIIQAKQYGADMILLIVAMLQDDQLRSFYQCARGLGLECIVEVHNEEEMRRALSIQPEIIGINNRNLYTFDVSLNTTCKLISMVPFTTTIVAESGIFTHADMMKMQEAGADAVLIGESFMRSRNIAQHVKELRYGKS